ncbi:MAG: hypothetical protein LBU62_03535 [Bacteroidales bacterium]|jgi:hypothetical protein|nr:hypothetical protein [Bacteroidales bacterium]
MFFSTMPSFLYLIPAVFYVANLLFMVISKHEQDPVCAKQTENVLIVEQKPVQCASCAVYGATTAQQADAYTFSVNEWFTPPDIQALPVAYTSVPAVKSIFQPSFFSRPPPNV